MKKILLLVITAALAASLSSCSFLGPIPNTVTGTETESKEETVTDEITFDLTELHIDLTGDHMPYYETCVRYGWSLLDKEQKQMYKSVLEAALLYEDSVSLPDDGTAKFIYECVFFDTPELFYLDETPQIKDGTVYFRYAFERDYAAELAEELDAAYGAFISSEGIDGDTSGYETLTSLYEYIINRTKYAEEADADYEADVYNERVYRSVCAAGPLVDGRSICIGYARATQYLGLRCGMQVFTVKGAGSSGRHYYSLVLLDGAYYYVDTTWGDPVGEDRSIDYLTYNYFCITTEELLRSHEIRTDIPLPVCTEEKYNYFVYNGLYSNDPEEIAGLIFDAYEAGLEKAQVKTDRDKLEKILKKIQPAIKKVFKDNGVTDVQFGVAMSDGPSLISVYFR